MDSNQPLDFGPGIALPVVDLYLLSVVAARPAQYPRGGGEK